VTRSDQAKTGHSPSLRLFEAAACAVPVISDYWKGIEDFFVPGEEILIAGDSAEVLRYLRELPEAERLALGQRARAKVLGAHPRLIGPRSWKAISWLLPVKNSGCRVAALLVNKGTRLGELTQKRARFVGEISATSNQKRGASFR
jgi:hypothetical protein